MKFTNRRTNGFNLFLCLKKALPTSELLENPPKDRFFGKTTISGPFKFSRIWRKLIKQKLKIMGDCVSVDAYHRQIERNLQVEDKVFFVSYFV